MWLLMGCEWQAIRNLWDKFCLLKFLWVLFPQMGLWFVKIFPCKGYSHHNYCYIKLIEHICIMYTYSVIQTRMMVHVWFIKTIITTTLCTWQILLTNEHVELGSWDIISVCGPLWRLYSHYTCDTCEMNWGQKIFKTTRQCVDNTTKENWLCCYRGIDKHAVY